VPSYPFFPAQIVDPEADPEDVGEDVLSKQPPASQSKTWLVRFFDAQESYGWIGAGKLDMLGEDDCEHRDFAARHDCGQGLYSLGPLTYYILCGNGTNT
jgi:NuA3 HAT complex component NTO1